MPMLSMVSMIADTLLVRPVDMPTPWYSVASGVMSVIVSLLLLGIAVAILGMARALKNAESNFGGRIQGLTDELIPLAKNLNQIATQLSEVTTAARGDLARLSGTVATVDDAVREALDAGESRLARFGTLIDAVQDEAQAVVASATGLVRGLRTGAGSLASDVFRRNGSARRSAPRAMPTARDEPAAGPLDESKIRARIAALDAALAALDDEDDIEDAEIGTITAIEQRAGRRAGDAADERDGASMADQGEARDDDLDDDDLDDDDYDDDDDDLDDDEFDDDDADDDDDLDDDEDDDDDAVLDDAADDAPAAPRAGGPRIRHRHRA